VDILSACRRHAVGARALYLSTKREERVLAPADTKSKIDGANKIRLIDFSPQSKWFMLGNE
jgi:hypothetical protein